DAGALNGDGLVDVVLSTAHGNREGDPTSVSAHLAVFLNGTSVPFLNKNSASYSTGAMATESIVAAFAHAVPVIAPGTGSSVSAPPPVTLAGTTITVKDSAGAVRRASLFYVSKGQIN